MRRWPWVVATLGSAAIGIAIGAAWWLGGPGQRSVFNTYLMPNDPMPDCGAMGLGRYKASSGHPGGVNMILGDGSVHFVKDHIEPETWRAISTRSDAEVVGSYCG